jgi:hypothetical protein
MSDQDTNKCRWCGDEFLVGWTETFCTDQCDVEYINEYYR